MKGVKPPVYIREFRAVPEGDGVAVKYYSEIMGFQKIGAKLAKNGNLPEIPKYADKMEEALILLEKWNKWLKEESIHSSGTRRKRSSSRR